MKMVVSGPKNSLKTKGKTNFPLRIEVKLSCLFSGESMNASQGVERAAFFLEKVIFKLLGWDAIFFKGCSLLNENKHDLLPIVIRTRR